MKININKNERKYFLSWLANIFTLLFIIIFSLNLFKLKFIFEIEIEKVIEIYSEFFITTLTIVIPLMVIPIDKLGEKHSFLKDIFVKETKFFSFFLLLIFTIFSNLFYFIMKKINIDINLITILLFSISLSIFYFFSNNQKITIQKNIYFLSLINIIISLMLILVYYLIDKSLLIYNKIEIYYFIYFSIILIYIFSIMYRIVKMIITIYDNDCQIELINKYFDEYEESYLEKISSDKLQQVIDYIDKVYDLRNDNEKETLQEIKIKCNENGIIDDNLFNSINNLILSSNKFSNFSDILFFYNILFSINSRDLFYQFSDLTISKILISTDNNIKNWIDLYWQMSIKRKNSFKNNMQILFFKLFSINANSLDLENNKLFFLKKIYTLIKDEIYIIENKNDINNVEIKNEEIMNIMYLGDIFIMIYNFLIQSNEENEKYFEDFILRFVDFLESSFTFDIFYFWDEIVLAFYNDEKINLLKTIIKRKYIFYFNKVNEKNIFPTFPLSIIAHSFIRKFESLNDDIDNIKFQMIIDDINKTYNIDEYLFDQYIRFLNRTDIYDEFKKKNSNCDIDLYSFSNEGKVNSELLFILLLVLMKKNSNKNIIEILKLSLMINNKNNKPLIYYLFLYKNNTDWDNPKHIGVDNYFIKYKNKIISDLGISETLINQWLNFPKPKNNNDIEIWIIFFELMNKNDLVLKIIKQGLYEINKNIKKLP